jgi:hypothetical protein
MRLMTAQSHDSLIGIIWCDRAMIRLNQLNWTKPESIQNLKKLIITGRVQFSRIARRSDRTKASSRVASAGVVAAAARLNSTQL